MKPITIIALFILFAATATAQSVAINTDGSPADASAALDIKSTSKGMLAPRMTTVQRDAITSPANGLTIYNTTTKSFNYYETNAWKEIGGIGLPTGAVIMSQTKHDPVLENNGFTYLGYLNSTIDGQEQSTDIPANTWYPVNQTEPDNASSPLCGKYYGNFWDGTNVFGVNFNSIFYYNPATDKYTYDALASPVLFPGTVYRYDIVLCGDYIILYGSNNTQNVGYKLHLPTKTWSRINLVGSPLYRTDNMFVSTGSKLIIWGGQNASRDYFRDGGIYDPVTDAWTTINAPNLLLNIRSRIGASAIWTGTQLIVWGGYTEATASSNTANCVGTSYTNYTYYNDGFKYTPSTGAYSHINKNTLEPRALHGAVWTGTEMVIWGGNSQSETIVATQYTDNSTVPPSVYYTCNTNYDNHEFKSGAKFNPATNTWTYMQTPAGLGEAAAPKLIWTGTSVIALNPLSHKIPVYNPASNTWSTSTYPDFPASNGYAYTNPNTLLWTGDKLLAFGYCTANSHTVGCALSATDPVTLNTVTNAIAAKFYLYKKN